MCQCLLRKGNAASPCKIGIYLLRYSYRPAANWQPTPPAKGMGSVKNSESTENYLETILILQNRQGQARSIDVATEMGFSKPSISFAMKKFRENGLITIDDDGFIHLTKEGLAIAESVYEKHRYLAQFLMALGVSEKTAREDACRLEHVLSQESFQKIKEHGQSMPK